MKTCSKCNTVNAANAEHCVICGMKLTAVSTEQHAGEYADAYFAREEQKSWRRRLIHITFLGCFTVCYIVLCVWKLDIESLSTAVLLFFICFLGFILCVLYPKILFLLRHAMEIENIDDVEPSGWYYFGAKIGGYALLAGGMILLLQLLGIL